MTSFYLLLWRCIAAALILTAMCAPPASAQPNFSFRAGITNVMLEDGTMHPGWSVGSVGKFDVFEVVSLLRFRMQLDVDKVRMENLATEHVTGDQSVTFVCGGLGVETAIGTEDFYVFANLTPHGTLRTTIRHEISETGESVITDVTRLTLGIASGVGAEIFLVDRLGLEALVQYDIYNVDPYDDEPRYRTIRATLGLQFYLGTNFKR